MLEAIIDVEQWGEKEWRVRLQGAAGARKLSPVARLIDADLAGVKGLPPSAQTWEGLGAALSPNGEFRPTLGQLEAIGALLRTRLFGEAPDWLSEMEAQASTRQGPLRFALVLDEEDAALESLPWELFRVGTSFLFKRRLRGAARCVAAVPSAPAARLARGDTLLIVTAHEDGRTPDPAALAAHALAVGASAEAAGLVVEHLAHATRDALRERLAQGDRALDALYIVCHGQHDGPNRGRLVLRGKSLSGTDLASWIADRAERTGPLQAVILCACSSSVPAPGTAGMAQWLVKKDTRWKGLRAAAVHAALGFRGPVAVDWALAFMAHLFASVGGGATIEMAVAAARAEQAEADPQWTLPLLYTPHLDAGAASRGMGLDAAMRGMEPESLHDVLPLASLLPRAPVPYFVARESELAKLGAWLATPGSAAITSVAGEGGVGKTEIAHKLAHETASHGRTVIWIDALGRDARTLASMLLRHVDPAARIEASDTDDAVTARAREALRPHDGLLVIDDVADPQTVQALSPGGGWNVVVTTRTPGLMPGFEDVPILPMTAEEGMRLLARTAWDAEEPPEPEREAARRLVELLGGLTLAIDLAGHTLRQGHLSVAAYIASYALPEGAAATDRQRAEAALLRARSGLDEQASRALEVLSVMPRAGATRQMMTVALEGTEPEADRALTRLHRWGLVGFVAATGRFTLHPLVRAAVKRETQAVPEGWERALAGVERAMGVVGESLSPRDDIEQAFQRWSEVRDLFDTLDLAVWRSKGRRSAAIADAFVSADQLRLDESWDARRASIELAVALAPLERTFLHAELQHARGKIRRRQGDLEGAALDFEAALALYEGVGHRQGQAHVRRARADLRLDQDPDGAALDLEAALALYQEIGDGLGQANVQLVRGFLRVTQTDLEGAALDFEAALALYQGLSDRLGQANVQGGQGDLLMQRGDPREALTRYRRAEAGYRALGDGWSLSMVAAKIACASELAGLVDDARAAAQEAIDLASHAQSAAARDFARGVLERLAQGDETVGSDASD